MGLAASQARLLTLTSRLSQCSMKQQNLAMSKLRLAADKDNLSLEYSDKLNNQTLKTKDDKPITLKDLEAMGYSVMRTSDEEIAAKNTTIRTIKYKKSEPVAPERPGFAKPTEKPTRVNLTAKESDKIQNAISSKALGSIQDLIDTVNDWAEKDCSADKNRLDKEEDLTKMKGNIVDSVENLILNLEEKTENRDNNQPVKDIMLKLKECNEAFEKVGIDKIDSDVNSSVSGLKKVLGEAKTVLANFYAGQPVVFDKTEAELQQENQSYNNKIKAWNDYETKQANYENEYKAYLESSYEETTQVPENETYKKCQNSQFLIQGLLNGYLALVKDGKVVSLEANTDVLTEYDKSDDAAAESKYNSELNKIDRKEKAMDLQMRRLETEYSSITTEINSVQNLVTKHAQKDFQLFS